MKTRSLWVNIIAFLLIGVQYVSFVSAQVNHGGMPLPVVLEQANGLRSSFASYPYEQMPQVDVEALIREDSMSGMRTQRFAHKFNVSLGMENSGVTTYLADGTKVWRLGITSKGAYSLNILFSEYDIPAQAKVFVYSPNRSTILGSFTKANRQRSGILPIAPVEGDSLVVEYIEPAGSDFEGRLRVGEVNHDYVGFRLLPSKVQSKSCEVDVKCDERSQLPQVRSVCLIIISGSYYCTGTLVNNTAEDDTPYILSASHCLFADGETPPVAEDLAETCVFFFNYETPFCYSDIKGTMEQTVAGATVATSNYKYDMLLFKLNEPVPVDYRPFYSGWNVSEEMRPPFYMIHHPSGDLKKLSVEKDMVHTGSFYTMYFLANSHWRVDWWEQGISEGGSSGSPLFDADNRIVGALSGGSTSISCSQRGDDNFYKLLLAWTKPKEDSLRLSTYLDPTETGALQLDGKEANGALCVRLSNIQQGEGLLPDQESRSGYASGHNAYGYLRYAEKFEAEGESKIYGIYFVPFSGVFSEENSVKVSIYAGATEPTTLLHEQVLKISNSIYSQRDNGISDVLATTWTGKENYLRLDTAVSVEGNFFVVFDLPETPTKKFALLYSDERWDNKNTAYFYHSGEWLPFTQNPMVKRGTSLMVDVVCQCSSNAMQPEHNPRKRTAVVAEKGQFYLLFEEGKGKKEVVVYDVSGRLMSKMVSENDRSMLDVPMGVSLVRVVYADYTETLKVVR